MGYIVWVSSLVCIQCYTNKQHLVPLDIVRAMRIIIMLTIVPLLLASDREYSRQKKLAVEASSKQGSLFRICD